MFLSNISGKVYGLGTTMILANFVSPEAVGAYVGADKLRIACQYIITPVEDVLFPKINQLFIQKSKNLFLFIKTSIIYLVGLTFLIFLFVNLFGGLLCKILFPENWNQIFLLLKILSPIIFISAFVTLLGTNLLIPAGMSKTFSLIEITNSLLHILILIPGCIYFSSRGAAFSFLLSQIFYFITLLVILYFKKTNNVFAANKNSFLLSIIRS